MYNFFFLSLLTLMTTVILCFCNTLLFSWSFPFLFCSIPFYIIPFLLRILLIYTSRALQSHVNTISCPKGLLLLLATPFKVIAPLIEPLGAISMSFGLQMGRLKSQMIWFFLSIFFHKKYKTQKVYFLLFPFIVILFNIQIFIFVNYGESFGKLSSLLWNLVVSSEPFPIFHAFLRKTCNKKSFCFQSFSAGLQAKKSEF